MKRGDNCVNKSSDSHGSDLSDNITSLELRWEQSAQIDSGLSDTIQSPKLR